MSRFHTENVLTPAQKDVFAKLSILKRVGVLAGGTALAFQFQHRRSFDFDIFTTKDIPEDLAWEVKKIFGKIKIFKESENELTFFTSRKVKITFLHYPFRPLYKIIKTNQISLFDWRDIAADKAYTLGRRPIYRDYVDLFFIIKKRGCKIENIISDAKKKFKDLFSEKLFLRQLIYFGDLKDFSIEFLDEKYAPGEMKSFFEKVVEQYTKNIFKKK